MEHHLLISKEQIQQKIAFLANEINAQYQNQEVTIIVILKGAICFLVDLMRHLRFPFTLEFISASSYGMRGKKPGEVIVRGIENLDLKDKEVLLLDDIFDTGKTLETIVKEIEKKRTKTLQIAVLLKKKGTSKTTVDPDFVCFDIEDHFVVGYGLDYKEHFRGLEGIHIFKQ